jgi:hypothetical protein
MLDELGLGDDSTLFIHFRIPVESLDHGLIPLMSVEDVVTIFKSVGHADYRIFGMCNILCENSISKRFSFMYEFGLFCLFY